MLELAAVQYNRYKHFLPQRTILERNGLRYKHNFFFMRQRTILERKRLCDFTYHIHKLS